MAITQTGSISEFNGAGTANSGTVSAAITVPSDAELVIVTLSAYTATANFFTGGGSIVTFTKGGADTTMTVGTAAGNASTSFSMGAIWYLVSPDTGVNKSLKWDWQGAGSAGTGTLWTASFWKGIDTSTPVRDADGAQASGVPFTSPTMTAQTGDLIVAWAFGDTVIEATIDTWSNLTLLSQFTRAASGSDGAMATNSPTGDTAVAASTASNWLDGGIVALVLAPAAAADFKPFAYSVHQGGGRLLIKPMGY